MDIAKFVEGVILCGTVIGVFVEVTPVKISPLAWIGNRLNRDLKEDVNKLNKRVDALYDEKETEELERIRAQILDFANACLNHRKHTKEQFDFIISKCDYYENYIEENKLKNGVITEAIQTIREIYHRCSIEQSFLKKEEND